MLLAPERKPTVGEEYVIARHGEGVGHAGQLVAKADTHAVLLVPAGRGAGRRVVLFGRALDVYAIKSLSLTESAIVRLWESERQPGVDLTGGGRVRVGSPTEGRSVAASRRRGPY